MKQMPHLVPAIVHKRWSTHSGGILEQSSCRVGRVSCRRSNSDRNTYKKKKRCSCHPQHLSPRPPSEQSTFPNRPATVPQIGAIGAQIKQGATCIPTGPPEHALLVFPFSQQPSPPTSEDTKDVLDFLNSSRPGRLDRLPGPRTADNPYKVNPCHDDQVFRRLATSQGGAKEIATTNLLTHDRSNCTKRREAYDPESRIMNISRTTGQLNGWVTLVIHRTIHSRASQLPSTQTPAVCPEARGPITPFQ